MNRSFAQLGLGLVVVAGGAKAAEASTVLVTGDHGGRDALIAMLEAEGHAVVVDAVPRAATLANVDLVWHAGERAIDATARKDLLDFLSSGGGVMLTAEPGFDNGFDVSVENIVEHAVGTQVATNRIDFDPAPQADGTHFFSERAPGGVTQLPVQLTAWQPIGVGGINGVAERNVLTRDSDGTPTSVAWADHELVTGGRMIVMMDGDWVSRGDAAVIANNFVQFLSTQVVEDGIGGCGDAIVDPGEGCDDGNDEGGDGCDPGCAPEEPTVPDQPDVPGGEIPDPDNDVETGGEPTAEGDGDEVDVIDSTAGCSAGGGGAETGGLVLLGLGLALALTRRKA